MLETGVIQNRLHRMDSVALAFALERHGHSRHYARVDELEKKRGKVLAAGFTRHPVELHHDQVVRLTLATLIMSNAADVKAEPTGKRLLAFSERFAQLFDRF